MLSVQGSGALSAIIDTNYLHSARYNNFIMQEPQYDNEEEQFLTELRNRNAHRQSENSGVSKQRSQVLTNLKQPATKLHEAMVRNRFKRQFALLKENIDGLQKECEEKYGGTAFMLAELERIQMTPDEYVDYCLRRVRSNFELPRMKVHEESKERSHLPRKPKDSCKYNKWFMAADARFVQSKQLTRHDWNKDNFILNIVGQTRTELDHECLPRFIKRCKELSKREPLLCKYAIIRSDKHY